MANYSKRFSKMLPEGILNEAGIQDPSGPQSLNGQTSAIFMKDIVTNANKMTIATLNQFSLIQFMFYSIPCPIKYVNP